MKHDEALWKVVVYRKGKDPKTYRRQTDTEAKAHERRALNDPNIASVKVTRETNLR